ncbi:MAG: mannitol dehydrogenase family protein [Brevundimonas sp.]|uniref:mannitol dehydrogenase family protein n=1 Tax=Brevundimonas sp. TaxID=1871086 RepID=UPI00272076CF|nr:mannitol dehydrogenase family protein [Brevundimonas sp.]MDO9607987.1 mannitol dehydrogenase family protein [Brevundimonas sp.]
MTRLNKASAETLDARILRSVYERPSTPGVVHLGTGAFNRAHQAVYADAALEHGDSVAAILGVSLRSPTARDQLVPQDGLFTVTERSGEGAVTRLVRSVNDVLFAPQSPRDVIKAMAAETTGLATLTVTEAGYLAGPAGDLDLASPAVMADLKGEGAPLSIYGFLRAALHERKAAGQRGLTILSCDNLAANGRRLALWLDQFLLAADPGLAAWTRAECRFPSCMVDRIVPATTAADRDELKTRLGVDDHAAVFTEPFSQWVVEDAFVGDRPRWDAGGAQFVSDVAPYETAKLRMLNGAHSALAYIGLREGWVFVHEAIRDPRIGDRVERLMRAEATTSLSPAPGQDLQAYADRLIDRFANPALNHRLDQIAKDGSEKIVQRWLPVLAHHQAADRLCPATLEALAAWMVFVRGDHGPVVDPLADRLADLWRQAGAKNIAAALFGRGGLLAVHWTASPVNLARLTELINDDGRTG